METFRFWKNDLRVGVTLIPNGPGGLDEKSSEILTAPMHFHPQVAEIVRRLGLKEGDLVANEGMRAALALATPIVPARIVGRFLDNLEELPNEVILYWFTLCYYSRRQKAGRAALRVLLTTPDNK